MWKATSEAVEVDREAGVGEEREDHRARAEAVERVPVGRVDGLAARVAAAATSGRSGRGARSAWSDPDARKYGRRVRQDAALVDQEVAARAVGRDRKTAQARARSGIALPAQQGAEALVRERLVESASRARDRAIDAAPIALADARARARLADPQHRAEARRSIGPERRHAFRPDPDPHRVVLRAHVPKPDRAVEGSRAIAGQWDPGQALLDWARGEIPSLDNLRPLANQPRETPRARARGRAKRAGESGSQGRLSAPGSHTTGRAVRHPAVREVARTPSKQKLRSSALTCSPPSLSLDARSLDPQRFRRLLPRARGLPSPSFRVSLDHRSLRASSSLTFGPSPQAATTTSADFCPALTEQISRGKTRDLRSIHPSHLRPSVRVTLGFESPRALALRRSASYALRVPRAGALPTASFPPHLAMTQLLFG